MPYQITTYICPVLVNGISIESLEDISAIEYQDALRGELSLVPRAKVLTKLWLSVESPGCTLAKGKVTAKICSTSDLDCPYCNETALLGWYRTVDIEYPPQGGMRVVRQPYITVSWNDPDQCHFVKSEIWMTNVSARPLGDEMWAYYNPAPSAGLIPIKRVCVCPNLRYSYSYETGQWSPCGYTISVSAAVSCPSNCPRCNTELEIGSDVTYPKSEVFNSGSHLSVDISDLTVPGELLRLRWCFDNTISYLAVIVASVYFNTPAVTGGEVTEVVGDYGDPDIRYKVDVEGTEFTCLSSDFAEYAVGDWVYLLRTNAPTASTCEREYTYGQSSIEDAAAEIDTDELLIRINEIRDDNNVDPLYMSPQLCAAARRHVNDMMQSHFIWHLGSDLSTVLERITDTGFLEGAEVGYTGENNAVGPESIDEIIDAWMRSTDHATNILDSNFKEMGIAWERGTSEWLGLKQYSRMYWCQTFGYNDAHDAVTPPVGVYRIVPFKINNLGPS